MSDWRTITDPRNSNKIELSTPLGIKILEYYEKRHKIINKRGRSKESVWDKIINPKSKRKVLLTGNKGTEVLVKYRSFLDKFQRRNKKKQTELKMRQNLLKMRSSKKKQPVRPNFKNPYTAQSKKICSTTTSYLRKFKSENKIIINEVLLKKLGYRLKAPVKIPIPNFTKDGPTINKFEERFYILCGIYKELASEKVTRQDFFTNPGVKTQKKIRIFNEIRKDLIQYIFTFIGGGGSKTKDFNVDHHYVDDIVGMLKTMSGVSSAPTGPIGNSVVIPVAPTTPLRRRTGTRLMS